MHVWCGIHPEWILLPTDFDHRRSGPSVSCRHMSILLWGFCGTIDVDRRCSDWMFGPMGASLDIVWRATKMPLKGGCEIDCHPLWSMSGTRRKNLWWLRRVAWRLEGCSNVANKPWIPFDLDVQLAAFFFYWIRLVQDCIFLDPLTLAWDHWRIDLVMGIPLHFLALLPTCMHRMERYFCVKYRPTLVCTCLEMLASWNWVCRVEQWFVFVCLVVWGWVKSICYFFWYIPPWFRDDHSNRRFLLWLLWYRIYLK